MKRWSLAVLVFLMLLSMLGCDGDILIPGLQNTELFISIEGEGSVYPVRGTYEKNELVTIQVTPAQGWTFSHWTCTHGQETEVVVGSLGKWEILMDTDKHLTAVFVELQYSLSIEIIGEGDVHHGLLVTPLSYLYPAKMVVSLVALPHEESHFSHWEGDVLDSYEDLTSIVMDGDKVVRAIFAREGDEDMYRVTFVVKSVTLGYEPIAGATITFNQRVGTTDENGRCVFSSVVPGTNYPYVVTAPGYSQMEGTVNVVNADIEVVINMSPKPEEGNQVHFSGVMFYDILQQGWTEIPFLANGYYDAFGLKTDDFVGSGDYPSNSHAFPHAVATTFDGIAIDEGTRLIIYSQENFQGEILIDVYGPMLINNVIWINISQVADFLTKTFEPQELHDRFPPETRFWSESNMHSWSYGSCRIRTSSDPDFYDEF